MTHERIVRHLVTAALIVVFALGCDTQNAETPPVPSALQPYVLDAVPSDVQHRVLIDFENKVQLVAYELEPEGMLRDGARVTLRLYWKPLERLRPDADGREWKPFTELLTRSGRPHPNGRFEDQGMLRQRGPSGGPVLPPSTWVPGKIYIDEAVLVLPTPLQSPELQFTVGFEKGWDFPARIEPAEENAGGAGGAATEADPETTAPSAGGAPPTIERPIRLRIVSGLSDGEGRGIVARRPVSFDVEAALKKLSARAQKGPGRALPNFNDRPRTRKGLRPEAGRPGGPRQRSPRRAIPGQPGAPNRPDRAAPRQPRTQPGRPQPRPNPSP